MRPLLAAEHNDAADGGAGRFAADVRDGVAATAAAATVHYVLRW